MKFRGETGIKNWPGLVLGQTLIWALITHGLIFFGGQNLSLQDPFHHIALESLVLREAGSSTVQSRPFQTHHTINSWLSPISFSSPRTTDNKYPLGEDSYILGPSTQQAFLITGIYPHPLSSPISGALERDVNPGKKHSSYLRT